LDKLRDFLPSCSRFTLSKWGGGDSGEGKLWQISGKRKKEKTQRHTCLEYLDGPSSRAAGGWGLFARRERSGRRGWGALLFSELPGSTPPVEQSRSEET